MKYNVIFNNQIESDLSLAYDYYELQSPELGSDFLLAVEASLNYIERAPLQCQKIYGEKRKANTKKFPYGIFFVVKGHTIFIIGIIHLAKSPRIWKSRKY